MAVHIHNAKRDQHARRTEMLAIAQDCPAGALVMAGADYRSTLCARSRGRRGIPVWLINQGVQSCSSAHGWCQPHYAMAFCDDHGKSTFC